MQANLNNIKVGTTLILKRNPDYFFDLDSLWIVERIYSDQDTIILFDSIKEDDTTIDVRYLGDFDIVEPEQPKVYSVFKPATGSFWHNLSMDEVIERCGNCPGFIIIENPKFVTVKTETKYTLE